MTSIPLVLLHPLGADRTFWEPLVSRFGSRDTVTVDLPGHGSGSELRAGATIDDMTDDVAAELNDRGITRCDVVGMSLGGLVAQCMAVRHRALVNMLVLADTLLVYPDEMRSMWRQRAAIARRDGTAEVVEATLSTWFTEAALAAGGPEVERTKVVLGRMSGEAYARTCELLREVDLADNLSEIDVPALVVCGSEDGGPFVAAARVLAGVIPCSRLEWLAGRHAVVLERPSEFVHIVEDFLNEAQGDPVRNC